MKDFKFTADATIYAENIDDAFARLAIHFKALAEGQQSDVAVFTGEMHIEPIKK